MRLIKNTGIGSGIILIIGIITISIYLLQKKPERNGVLEIKGLKDKVEVIYDDFGVPHIYAQNDEDMYRSFGYVHAQDRLFQMDLLSRLGQGRLAEMFGKSTVNLDRVFRTMQLGRFTGYWMKQMEKRASRKMLNAIDAYLDGINQFIQEGPTPIEFDLLGVDKRKFTRKDLAAVFGYMSYSFTLGLSQDLVVTTLSHDLGKKYLKDLGIRWQEGSAQIPVNQKGVKLLAKEISTVIDQLIPLGFFHGSNGWVVSPDRTQSGKAMLVNDPHMGFSQPSVWYEAHLVSPESEIYGHHLALLPFALLGNNQDIAWGLTMFVNDDIDLFKEKVNPENPNQYWVIDHWEEFELSEEVIKVKDAEDVVLKLKKSRHGPIITEAFSEFEDENNPFYQTDEQLAMWWVFFDSDNDLLTAFYDLARSKNVRQAANAVAQIYSPGLNVMYADKHGDIAWWASARLPIRPKHVNSSMILDGSSGKDDPLGYYDFSKNPQALNPASGAIYTANNQPADTGIGLIPGYYVPRDRAERISQLLFADENKWNDEKMKNMLLDTTTPLVEEVKRIVVPILSLDSAIEKSYLTREALAVFRNWQGNHDPELVSPTLFYYFKKELFRQIMLDEMGEHSFGIYQRGYLMRKTIWKLLPNGESPWWDNIKTQNKKETRNDIVVSAWIAAIRQLEAKFGSNLEKWKWKYAISLESEHPLGTATPLNHIFNVGPLTVPGGNGLINNLEFNISKEDFKVGYGPSTRRIVDFGDIEHSWGINPTGQSGVVVDKHYDDQSEMFANGAFRRQYIQKSEIMEHKAGILIMQPVSN